MKKRYDIEAIRFIASFAVMIFHGNFFRLGYTKRYIAGGWILVELFFMMTGYFTANHFEIGGEKKTTIARISVDYVIKKYAAIYFFFLTALTGTYAVGFVADVVNGKVFGNTLLLDISGFIMESLLLYGTGYCDSKMATGWFVSAMFWVLPIIVYLLIRCQSLFYIMSGIIPILFYANRGVLMRQGGFDDILRAFCAMTLGVFVYTVSRMLKEAMKIYNNRVHMIICTAFILVDIVLVGYYIGKTEEYQFLESNIVLVLLFLLLVLIFSRDDLLGRFTYNKAVDYLGRLSLPIYMYQLLSGKISGYLISKIGFGEISGMILYFTLTIVLSVIALEVYSRIFYRRTV